MNPCGDLPTLGFVRAATGRQRSVRIANLFLIAVTAFFIARSINTAIGMKLHGDLVPPARFTGAEPPVQALSPGSRSADDSVIFRRNLFGLEQGAVSRSVEGQGRVKSAAGLKLRGTAEVTSGIGYAVFEDTSERKQDLFATGDSIFGGPRLVSVSTDTAVILQGGVRTTVEIVREEDVGGTAANHGGGRTSGVRKTGTGEYLVARREVDHSLDNLNQVITQVRATPYLRNGKALGFRLFAIRKGSIFERMGLLNGDVVQTVNGTPLDSPSAAVGLLDIIRTADVIRLDLLRKDKPTTLSYKLR